MAVPSRWTLPRHGRQPGEHGEYAAPAYVPEVIDGELQRHESRLDGPPRCRQGEPLVLWQQRSAPRRSLKFRRSSKGCVYDNSGNRCPQRRFLPAHTHSSAQGGICPAASEFPSLSLRRISFR
jgi:hypothetical protein